MFQAREKIHNLEQSISQAQDTERKILEMTNWMSDISDLLQKRIEADVVAGDVPGEHDSLKEEFKQNEEMLAELEVFAADLESQGNMEASARLHEQIELLKKHYTEVSIKFRKFQRPADFEPKFSRVKRELDSIGEQIHLVEIGSEDPGTLQEKLDISVVSYPIVSSTNLKMKTLSSCFDMNFKQCIFFCYLCQMIFLDLRIQNFQKSAEISMHNDE